MYYLFDKTLKISQNLFIYLFFKEKKVILVEFALPCTSFFRRDQTKGDDSSCLGSWSFNVP